MREGWYGREVVVAAMSENKPRIRIVNQTGIATDTRVFDANGVEITSAITEVTIHMKVGEFNTAEIKTLMAATEIDAVITDLQTQVLPPPQPKPQLRFRTHEGVDQDHWILERVIPLPTYGVREEVVVSGLCDKIGYLVEIVQDVEE